MLAVSKKRRGPCGGIALLDKGSHVITPSPFYLPVPMIWHHCIQIFLGLITFARYGSPDSSNRVDVDVAKIILFS